MKKRDIIQLVKETIKETTFYGNRHQRSSISGLPGVMEDEDLEEITTTPVSGTKAGFIDSLDNRKYVLTSDINIKNGSSFDRAGFISIDLPKGTEINNFPGGVFAKHPELENLKDYRSFGLQITQSPENLSAIEKNSNIIDEEVSEEIKADDFKNNPKLQPGKTVKYAGTSRKIEKNDGFILTLDNGEKVNLGQFNKRGTIKEKNMKESLTVSKLTNKSDSAQLAKAANTTVTAVQKAIDAAKKTGLDQTVAEEEINEEPNEGNAFAVARLKAIKAGDKKFKLGDKEFDVTNVSDDDKKAADELDETMYTNDIGKDDYMDDEGRMAKSQIYKMGKYAVKLHDMLDDMEQLPAWVQSKITKASDYMSMVYHYLDYEFARRDSNLMEHVDKHRKRDMLMEGAMKRFFEMFDKGMTDKEIVQSYAKKGITVPETFVSKTRKNYEEAKKMKLELEMSEKEFRNSSSKMVNNTEEGMESVEEKKLSSGLK